MWPCPQPFYFPAVPYMQQVEVPAYPEPLSYTAVHFTALIPNNTRAGMPPVMMAEPYPAPARHTKGRGKHTGPQVGQPPPSSGRVWRTRRDSAHDAVDDQDLTTLLLRNVPTTLPQKKLVELFDNLGLTFLYDFVYLPMDFRNGVNLGYGFVNCVSHQDAIQMMESLEDLRWEPGSDQTCKLSWSHYIQGLEGHLERYRNSPVMHPDMPEDWKPMLFSNGQRVPFPPPTKAIKAPKVSRGMPKP